MKKLEGKELYRRLQEAKNAKKLHEAAIQQKLALEEKIKEQANTIKVQAKQIKEMQQMLQSLQLQNEEFKRIIFGKKKKRDDDDHNDSSHGTGGKKTIMKRDKASYQRPVPPDITKTERYKIDCCDTCQTKLVNKRIVEKYIEDMVLPDEKVNPLKTVAKRLIETGWCETCRKQNSPQAINGAKVQLGPNIKAMVVYLTVVQRQTYS